MSYEFSELALQNDWGNYTVDDYPRSFAIRPYGEDIPYKTEAVQDTKQEPAPGKSDSQKSEQAISGLNNGQNYATLTKEQLMAVCIDKDAIIESCVKSLKAQCPKMLGKKEIMECGVKVSGCFNGNPVASAAGIVVADELSKPGVYENFQKLGDMLCDGFKELCCY